MNNKKVYKGEWCISSSTPNRKERLKAHKEFETSDLKRMLDEGWEIKAVRPKRPRIKKELQPRQVVVTLGGTWTVKMTLEEYKQRGDGLKIVMKIY